MKYSLNDLYRIIDKISSSAVYTMGMSYDSDGIMKIVLSEAFTGSLVLRLASNKVWYFYYVPLYLPPLKYIPDPPIQKGLIDIESNLRKIWRKFTPV